MPGFSALVIATLPVASMWSVGVLSNLASRSASLRYYVSNLGTPPRLPGCPSLLPACVLFVSYYFQIKSETHCITNRFRLISQKQHALHSRCRSVASEDPYASVVVDEREVGHCGPEGVKRLPLSPCLSVPSIVFVATTTLARLSNR